MKQYMLVQYGFEKPTPEIMSEWKKWFDAIGARTVEQKGITATSVLDSSGMRNITADLERATGYTILTAESMEEAQSIAIQCPFITSISIFELAG